MEDEMQRLLEAQNRAMKALSQGLLGCMDDLLGKALSPEALLGLMAAIGMDPSRISKTAGPDPYRVLGLERTAADEEIKKRYRKLVFMLHPDTAASEGTRYICQQVTEAYQRIARERGF